MMHLDILFLLILGHFVADYSLQSEFIVKAKNWYNPIPGINWQWIMSGHCYIHAGAVYLVTGSLLLAAVEFVVHFLTDTTKCSGLITFEQDQKIHIVTKFVIWLLYMGIML